MKAIDFTHTGGFPLTQERLDYLQQAYTECINTFATLGGNGSVPVIISGMVEAVPGPGTVAVSDGWFFYNGEMIQFTGATVSPTGADVPLVEITPVSTTLNYNDGSTYPAILNKTATLISGPTVTDALHFPLSSLQSFQLGFGLIGRESGWGTLGVATATAAGSVTGTIYYKKNFINNTLHIRASLTANSAQNFNASPAAIFSLMGTLPAEYAPSNLVYFISHYYAANLFKDDLGVSWVKQLTSQVNSSGQIYINFLRPDSAILAYSVTFNTIIPLD